MPARWTAIGAAAAAVLLTSAAATDPVDLSIPIDTAIDDGVAAGGEVPLVRIASADLDGAECGVRSVRRDGDTDTNSGNDLIVASGDDVVTLADVEREPGAMTDGGSLTLGATISVSLVVGEDERFAAAIDLQFRCDEGATTTSTTGTTGTTTEGSAPTDATGVSTSARDDDDAPTRAVVIGAVLVIFGAGAALIAWRRADRARTGS